jgi:hypothetical protein
MERALRQGRRALALAQETRRRPSRSARACYRTGSRLSSGSLRGRSGGSRRADYSLSRKGALRSNRRADGSLAWIRAVSASPLLFTNAAAGPARIARRRASPPRPERASDALTQRRSLERGRRSPLLVVRGLVAVVSIVHDAARKPPARRRHGRRSPRSCGDGVLLSTCGNPPGDAGTQDPDHPRGTEIYGEPRTLTRSSRWSPTSRSARPPTSTRTGRRFPAAGERAAGQRVMTRERVQAWLDAYVAARRSYAPVRDRRPLLPMRPTPTTVRRAAARA